jgi:hypothetical protein
VEKFCLLEYNDLCASSILEHKNIYVVCLYAMSYGNNLQVIGNLGQCEKIISEIEAETINL